MVAAPKHDKAGPRSDAGGAGSSAARPFQDADTTADIEALPSYSEAVASDEGHTHGSSLESASSGIMGKRLLRSDRLHRTSVVTLHEAYSTNSDVLCQLIKDQSSRPPNIEIVIEGTHTEERENFTGGNRSTDKDEVMDFRIRIDTTGMLFAFRNDTSENFHTTKITDDYDDVKTYRGGRFQERGGLKAGENASSTTMKNWCDRFCEDKANVKSFTFTRDVQDWDFKAVRLGLASVIRSVGYQGRICTWQHTLGSPVTIYSPSIFNRLRINTYIWWLCVLLQLWIVTWPILILLEHRYQTITSLWSTKSVVRDEDEGAFVPDHDMPMPIPTTRTIHSGPYSDERSLVRFLAPAVRDAALSRRRSGVIINTAVAERAQTAERDAQESLGGGARPRNRGGASTFTTSTGMGVDGVWMDANGIHLPDGSRMDASGIHMSDGNGMNAPGVHMSGGNGMNAPGIHVSGGNGMNAPGVHVSGSNWTNSSSWSSSGFGGGVRGSRWNRGGGWGANR